MIKIEVRLLPEGKSNVEIIETATYNAIAENLKGELVNKVSELECQVHKKATKGTVVVIASKDGVVKFEKKDFCCKELSDSIELKS